MRCLLILFSLVFFASCYENTDLGSESSSMTDIDSTEERALLITWDDLMVNDCKEMYIESYDAFFWQPIFDESILNLDYQLIEITSYLSLLKEDFGI